MTEGGVVGSTADRGWRKRRADGVSVVVSDNIVVL